MKLKIYHIITLTLLFLSLALSLTLGIISFIDLLTNPSQVLDNLILFVCFIILIAFTVLEIVNTFLSFKTGSVFVKSLAFDDKKVLNSPFLVILAIIGCFAVAGLIYSLYILANPVNELLLATSPLMLKNLLISVFALLIVDILIIELFPLLGKDDKAFLLENKK